MKPTRIINRKCGSRLSAGGAAWKAAEAYGIDMALLAANLKMTPLERMRRHDAALNACLELRPVPRLSRSLAIPVRGPKVKTDCGIRPGVDNGTMTAFGSIQTLLRAKKTLSAADLAGVSTRACAGMEDIPGAFR